MNTSESIAAIAEALCTFQGQVNAAGKNAKNPHLGNKYADLNSVWEAIKGPLAENGLSVVQLPAPGEVGRLNLKTRLMHKSGEWIESEIAMPLPKSDPQGYGSALTYARRYGLTAMLGIVQEDDDGHAASQKPETRRSEPTPQQRVERANGGGGGSLSEAQIKRLYAIAKKNGITSKDDLRVFIAGQEGFPEKETDLSRTQYDRLCDVLLPAQGATGDLGEWPEEVPA